MSTGGRNIILCVLWLSSIRVLIELEEFPRVCADVTIGPCEIDIVLDDIDYISTVSKVARC